MQLASNIPQFMTPVIVNRFPTPVLNYHCFRNNDLSYSMSELTIFCGLWKFARC